MSSGIASICRPASTTQVTASAAAANPASVRTGSRSTAGERQASRAASASMTTQVASAPAGPGAGYMAKLTVKPHSAGPITIPCASAIRSSDCRSATRATT